MKRIMFEGSEQMCNFVAQFLGKTGIKAEVVPLVWSSKDELNSMTGGNYFQGWNPTHTVRVPDHLVKTAEKIVHEASDYNWYKKRPKQIDVSKDIFFQQYGIKPIKKRRR